MDDERQAASPVTLEKTFQTSVVVCMSMGDDDGAQIFDADIENIEISADASGRQSPS
jgi:hypothetical protein